MASSWQFWALASAAFAAATALLSKVDLRGVDPDAAQLVRTAVVFAAVAAAAVATGRGRRPLEFTGTTWTYLVLAGFATASSWLCYYRALAVGEASRVAAVDKLSVPLVAVAAALLLREHLGVQGWLGVALAALGAALVSLEK